MRKRSMIAAALVAFTSGVLILAQSSRTAEVQFKAAQHKEQVEGDLKGAIEQYKKIAQSGNRALAAKALVAIGECYEKLGQSDARNAYERVVRDFADQAESVEEARARLAALALHASHAEAARQIWLARASDYPGESIPSADGRYIGFTDWETGDLAVRDLITGTSRRLTNTGGWQASGDFAEGSVISPDGHQIAYGWFSDKPGEEDLRIIPINGGTPRILYRSKRQHDWTTPQGWTPDARQLLAVRSLPDSTGQIVMISLEDGSVHVLKSLVRWRNTRASLSPDGRYIAYDGPKDDKTEARDIFVLSVDGSHDNAVVQNPANDYAPLWSPDGSRILFLSDRTGGYSLWAAPIEHGTLKGSAELVKPDVGGILPLGMTRAGALYYMPPGAIRSNVYSAELGANGKISSKPELATQRFLNSNVGPSLSHDGQYVAYYSLRPGSANATLVIRTLKTGEEKEVPLHREVWAVFGMGPKWFPGNRSMLLLLREPSGPGFDRIDLATGKIELLHVVGPNGFQGFTLSPDGKAIYYTQGINANAGVPTRLLRYDIESRKETELKSGEWFISPTVSPDGKQLAYLVSVRPGSTSYLAVMPATGLNPVRLAESLRDRGFEASGSGSFGRIVLRKTGRTAGSGSSEHRLHRLGRSICFQSLRGFVSQSECLTPWVGVRKTGCVSRLCSGSFGKTVLR